MIEINLNLQNTNIPERQMSNNQALVNEVLAALGLKAKSEAISSKKGLIALNFFVDTVERGRIVVRANELGDDNGVGFEVKTLDFLSRHNAPVPSILRFSDNSLEMHADNKRIISYIPIEGDTLSADELDNTQLAREAGSLLQTILVPAALYEPSGDEPDGDTDFIRRITDDFLSKYPDLEDHSFFNDAYAGLASINFIKSLKKSPQGIVHADFFYKNIIMRGKKLVGVIDFGDAYYGALINDVAIGAMEFSVLEADEQWRPDLFEAFLEPNAKWLQQSGIDFETFYRTLLANCLRFAVCTLGFARDDDPSTLADENRYVQRYFKFKEALAPQLRKSYESICG